MHDDFTTRVRQLAGLADDGDARRIAIAVLSALGGQLDEPTARLDVASERALVEGAARLLEGRTALVVAHRPALLSLADRVVRLQDGRLSEPVSEPVSEPAPGRGRSGVVEGGRAA